MSSPPQRDGRHGPPSARDVLAHVLLLAALSSGCGADDPVAPSDTPPHIEHWSDWDPAWSPDGSELAVRSNRSTRHVPDFDPRSVVYYDHYDLYLLDTLGNAVQVTDGYAGRPPTSTEGLSVRHHSWSPDGRIAFVGNTNSIWVVGRDGSDLRELWVQEGIVGRVAWSPTAGAIAFSWTPWCSDSGCAPHRISLLDTATGSVTLLTDPTVPSVFPTWSPDGSQLAFIGRPASESQVMRMNADGSGVAVLHEGGGSGLAWSPCGDEIAMVQFVSSAHRVVIVKVDGSGVRVLTEGTQPAWSPDCSRLAFIREFVSEVGFPGVDVWTIGADGSGARVLTRRE